MTIRTLIVEDELHERRYLRSLLEQEPDVELAGECGDAVAALTTLREHPPDLVFMDVRMPGGSGLHVLGAVNADVRPVAILVSAHEEYALRAFDLHVVDYLLKPFDPPRFQRALRWARERLAQRGAAALNERLEELLNGRRSTAVRYCERLTARVGARRVLVPVDDIDWIEAARNYARLHLGNGERLLVRESMDRLEVTLDPARFARVHRSAIVRLDRVAELVRSGTQWKVVLRGGQRLRVGDSYREPLRRLLRDGAP